MARFLIFFIAFKVRIPGTAIFFAVKWHHVKSKKRQKKCTPRRVLSR